MDITRPILSNISSTSFSFLSTEDIKKISVKKIENPTLLDNTNSPTVGGLYDPALGPMKKNDLCATCSLNSFRCPGHFGHIQLPAPVYHPLFMVNMFALLRGTCLYCHHFRLPQLQLTIFIARLQLLEYGLLRESEEIALESLQGKPLPASGPAKKPKKQKKKQTKKSSKKPKKPSDGDNGEDDGSGEEEDYGDDEEEEEGAVEGGVQLETESVPAFKARIREKVNTLIKEAVESNRGKQDLRGKGKDRASAVYAERKRTIAQFLKAILVRKCGRCKGVNPTLTKDGHIKITETEISAKQKASHAKDGIIRSDAMILEKELLEQSSKSNGRRKRSSSSASGSDSGSEAMEDNRMEDEDGGLELPSPNLITAPNGKQAKRQWTPKQSRANLRLLFHNEAEICGLIYGRRGPFEGGNLEEVNSQITSNLSINNGASADVFFMDVVFVAPTRFRPASVMGDQTFENPQNELLTKIINTTFKVKQYSDLWALASSKSAAPEAMVGEGGTEMDLESARGLNTQETAQAYRLVLESIIQLQQDVNSFVDSSKNPNQPGQGRMNPNGVKQILEKKEGLFRKHMMGKRVNYAARSVISPDVNIETNEIGVPPVFAKKLTFPEPVTIYNIEEMRQLVRNGPDVYPGAVSVRSEDGTETLLAKKTVQERAAIAAQLQTEQENTSRQAKGTFGGLGGSTRTSTINKQVMRHLKDGDILLLNRQPTLHKPSMMAHKAKVLKGEKTIRMHYANCNSYNADFDGDEMNMHFPQSQTARAECYNIANTDNQYLVPTSGNPLRGLIQDHVVAGVWMTCKDSLFEREEYQQLLYGALRPEEDYTGRGTGKVLTVSPAIWKPKALWTGKQIITTVLHNLKPSNAAGLTMTSKAKVAGRYWGKDHAMEEKVIFEDGELLSGVLDKSQFGASAYGLVHAIFEIYGPEYAGKLLSILSRLFTKFLQHKAFSCRMDDLLLSSKGDDIRAKLLREGKNGGMIAAMKSVGLEGHDPSKSDTDRNLRFRLEEVLREDDKLAALDAEMMSAANKLTSSIIDACIPDGLDKIFPHNNMQMMTVSGAKGSPVNVSQISCLLGSQALEGRRVPVMVSGKTLPSFKPFDTTSRAGGFIGGRFLTGIRPQEYYFHCMAGREGLIDTAVKTSRSGYLQRCLIKHLEGVTVHYDHTVRNSDGTILQFHYGEDALDVTKSKYLDQFDFTAQNFDSFGARYRPEKFSELIGTVLDVDAYDAARVHMRKALKKPHKYAPVLSEFPPARYFGATSEKFAQSIESYIEANANNLLESKKKKKSKKSKEEISTDGVVREVEKDLIRDARKKTKVESFRAMNHALYQRSLVEPGEAVGLLAAQGVGEPSTQMTLNTFHFAGHGAANVTLGIPRLREIVMTASQKIQTPIMKLPLLEGIDIQSPISKLFCKDGSRLLLSQVVEKATVTEKMLPKSSESNFERKKTFNIRLDFFPFAEYLEEYNAKPAQILKALSKGFVPNLEKEIKKELKQLAKDRALSIESLGQGQKPERVSGENSEENEDSSVSEPKKKGSKKASKKDQSIGRPAGADDGSDSDDDAIFDDEGDGDADDAKRKARSGAAVSYDEGDESTRKDLNPEDELLKQFDEDEESDSEEETDVDGTTQDVEMSVPTIKSNPVDPVKEAMKGLSKVLGKIDMFKNFEFDEESYEWVGFEIELAKEFNSAKILLIKVVEKACTNSVVHEIPKISRILAPPPTPGQSPALTAEGINFRGIWEQASHIVDLNQINTNDIGALLHTFGVEAARAGIVSEMAGIFKTYGIGVSMRHLYLIADYQTSAGGFRPFSRNGMQEASSPLLKASFEMTMKFLGDSALHGEIDQLDGPSANIVVGRPVHSGTGAAHVHLPVASNLVVARG